MRSVTQSVSLILSDVGDVDNLSIKFAIQGFKISVTDALKFVRSIKTALTQMKPKTINPKQETKENEKRQ